MAVGSYDDKVRLLNTLTWKLIGEMECLPSLRKVVIDSLKIVGLFLIGGSEIRRNSVTTGNAVR